MGGSWGGQVRGVGLGGSSWWGQGGCERRIEVFVKIQKKTFFFWGGGGVGCGVEGGQAGCERRIEDFVKIKKKKKKIWGGGGGRVGGVRVDVNVELKFL